MASTTAAPRRSFFLAVMKRCRVAGGVNGTVKGMDLLAAAPGAEIVFAAVAEEPGVHVVGGAVRDALLGREPRELDLVVEGDAVAVARRAAERVGGTLTVHERFGTATVAAGDVVFDLASARRERYAAAGGAAGRGTRRHASRRTSRAATSPSTRSRSGSSTAP